MISNSEKKVIEQYIKPDDVVFDVGFYIGQWSRYVIDNHDCTIYAFEAHNNIVPSGKFLHSRFTFFDDIVISDKNSAVDFYEYLDQPYLSTIHKRNDIVNTQKMGGERPNVLKKRSITLDFICRKHNIKHIDFMKIDVEGNEFNVLKGCEELLSKNKIDKIQFEAGECFIDSGITLKEVVNYLQHYGFKKFYKMTENNIGEVLTFNYIDDWSNYLCLKT